jgi:spermidine synthase
VVLPDPGGPQKIRDGKKSLLLSNLFITPPFPTKSSCPTKFFNVLGRSSSGRGIFVILTVYHQIKAETSIINQMLGTKILEERESKYNGHIRVARGLGFGTYIQAEGLTQSGGIVGTIWKPTLKKIKSQKSEIKSCLILGLGGGTAAKYVRLFWPGTRIFGIDIDPVMIELGKKYLGLNQIGVKIKIQDAAKFSGKYDLIIVDLYNGKNFPEKFGEISFLNKVRSSLSKKGIAVFNRTYYGEVRPDAVKFGLKLQKIFSRVEYFYPEANLMFLCAN